MIERINSIFDDTIISSFQTLLEISLIGSIVVFAAVIVQMSLSRWLSLRFFYVFWVLVILRFAMFATPESPTSFLNLVSQANDNVLLNDSAVVAETIVVAGEVYAKSGTTALANHSLLPQQVLAASEPFDFSSLVAPAIIVWLVGVAWMIVRLGFGYRSVLELLEQSQTASPKLNAI